MQNPCAADIRKRTPSVNVTQRPPGMNVAAIIITAKTVRVKISSGFILPTRLNM